MLAQIAVLGAHDLVETFPRVEIRMKNRINNIGKLLFYSGVARAVMTGDVKLEHFFREDVERLIGSMDVVNSDCDGVLIPLANAFRPEYASILRLLTRFVRATKLPCWVIGVGMQARSEAELRAGPVQQAEALSAEKLIPARLACAACMHYNGSDKRFTRREKQ